MGRAILAARSIAGSLGLAADDVRVLHDSNKLTLRLLPCDVVARVALAPDLTDRFELELAQLLADTGAPVGVVEPRVAPLAYAHDGFVATLWVYYASGPSEEIPPAGYAAALSRVARRYAHDRPPRSGLLRPGGIGAAAGDEPRSSARIWRPRTGSC